MKLDQKIDSRQAVVSVVGLGYVGLSLSVAFAEAGFRVVGIDLDEHRVASVNRGESYIPDVNQLELASVTVDATRRPGAAGGTEAPGLLSAVSSYSALSEVDAVIVCVPTPLGKTRDPDLSHIVFAAERVAKHLHSGLLVVLESTSYPGTTEEVILPRLQNANSKCSEVGRDFYLAFSPERIDPGQREWTVRNTPKVMGGVTQECLQVATRLYSCIVEKVVPVSSPREAEMVKLLENTFRATNIALVNEIAIMCNRLGIDVWEVIEAAKTKPFGFMPFYPGPGLGGHCIPVDPQYLAWKLRTLNYNARFVQLAEEINRSMPDYVVERVSDSLNGAGRPLKGSRVLVLGVAYKADVADYRESPALDVIQLLVEKGALVSYHDPFIPRFELDSLALSSIQLEESSLRESDCVVVTTAHSSYDWPWVVNNSSLVVDTRHATAGVESTSGRVVGL